MTFKFIDWYKRNNISKSNFNKNRYYEFLRKMFSKSLETSQFRIMKVESFQIPGPDSVGVKQFSKFSNTTFLQKSQNYASSKNPPCGPSNPSGSKANQSEVLQPWAGNFGDFGEWELISVFTKPGHTLLIKTPFPSFSAFFLKNSFWFCDQWANRLKLEKCLGRQKNVEGLNFDHEGLKYDHRLSTIVYYR